MVCAIRTMWLERIIIFDFSATGFGLARNASINFQPCMKCAVSKTMIEQFMNNYDPPLDPGIASAVRVLSDAGVETFESCQGGTGHAYPDPTVRFHGDQAEGFKALAVAIQGGLQVAELRRVWPLQDNEPTGPWWELTFIPTGNR